ncbi:protein phosphatase 2C domain-containing protein [Candidatus Epulonipiscium viviparus]|uniref:protein phosphatase 2C domain-containing protein n=1 Tax=Candidatus Epulonipiscium viviparus TaxID=420336 RepID=UPI00273811E4|nr:protein phosphatase 2C domain-containing protein [Candidatus Epulopiscium viviparus]
MLYTFNQSVQGYHHWMQNQPLQDYSASYTDPRNQYHIAVVADGHGSVECFRSDVGSAIVTTTAINYLKKFAAAVLESPDAIYNDLLFSAPKRCNSVRALTDSIVTTWNCAVVDHYHNNISQASAKDIATIYGTTFIAALHLPKCLILFQQGDGECVIFYENGRIAQPIPKDERCVENVTSSMCDPDAATRIRTKIIDLAETPVVACFLGTDGISDTYLDTYQAFSGSHYHMAGVHTFYKFLCLEVLKSTIDTSQFLSNFSRYGKFSRTGSGDDVSVSAIVDIEKLATFADKFCREIEIYAIEEKLYWKQDELRSKSRKYQILSTAAKNAKQTFAYSLPKYLIKNKFNSKHTVKISLTQHKKKVVKISALLKTNSQPQKAFQIAQKNFIAYKKIYTTLENECIALEEQLKQLKEGDF